MTFWNASEEFFFSFVSNALENRKIENLAKYAFNINLSEWKEKFCSRSLELLLFTLQREPQMFYFSISPKTIRKYF